MPKAKPPPVGPQDDPEGPALERLKTTTVGPAMLRGQSFVKSIDTFAATKARAKSPPAAKPTGQLAPTAEHKATGLTTAAQQLVGKEWVSKSGEQPAATLWFYGADHVPFGAFSNFAKTPIRMRCLCSGAEREYATTEHYFQAAKFAPHSAEDHDAVAGASTPGAAAKSGKSRQRPLREDWDTVKEGIMFDAVYNKARQHAAVAELLLSTGTEVIVEHTGRDRYWGDGGGKGTGANRLGVVLMQVRETLRAERTRMPAPPKAASPGTLTAARLAAKKASVSPGQHSTISEPASLAASEASGLEVTREPTMLHHQPGRLVPSPLPNMKYTIVLDLDETVVYGRDGELFARAGLKESLRRIGSVAEVVVWTAGERSYAKAVVKDINAGGVIQHLVYRDPTWFDEADYTKDLTKLGRDMDHTLIVENTPDCVRKNPNNGVIVSDYEGGTGAKQDATLSKLATLVEQLVASDQAVPAFLKQCPLVRKQRVDTGDHEIDIWYMSARRKKEADDGKVVMANRDKAAAVAAAAEKAPAKKRGRDE